MQLSDNEFFEEYKRLDKLCSEIYACQNGVSEYITQMENKPLQEQRRVNSWDTDYKMLKHVRWVRNQIAHDSGLYQISEPEDLKFVKDYRNRILSGQDSLTLLRKALEAEARQDKQQKNQQREQVKTAASAHTANTNPENTPPQNTPNDWVGYLVGSMILVLILLMLYFNR